ncbi:hypothetical protein FKM82_017853 [Ascaphus truei]
MGGVSARDRLSWVLPASPASRGGVSSLCRSIITLHISGHLDMLQNNFSVFPLQEYDFERRFDDQGAIQWMRENWNKSIFFSLLYAALIFGGQHVMKERRRFELRKPLVLWSLTLAVFSIIGAIRTSWYLGNILSARGFQQSVCDRGFYNGPVTKFWAYAFVLSKVPELGEYIPLDIL